MIVRACGAHTALTKLYSWVKRGGRISIAYWCPALEIRFC